VAVKQSQTANNETHTLQTDIAYAIAGWKSSMTSVRKSRTKIPQKAILPLLLSPLVSWSAVRMIPARSILQLLLPADAYKAGT
jgi:hypothetical protein